MQHSEGYVTTDDGVRLYFQKFGSGDNTLLVPNGITMIDDFKHLVGGRSIIFYDVRNRGLSDTVTEPSKLVRGIHHDVDDLEAVRNHFGIAKADLLGLSYMGLMVILYAMKYPAHVERIVQIGPMQPYADKQYPPYDGLLAQVLAQLGELQKESGSSSSEELCRKFWNILRVIYVVNPADVHKLDRWSRCHLPNEANFMQHWVGNVNPSIQALNLTADQIAKVTAPVLTIHGRADRSAPYGGGQDWVEALPNAQLVTIEYGGHGPWIEDPVRVFQSIQTFLSPLISAGEQSLSST